jgi:hypothetical protein
MSLVGKLTKEVLMFDDGFGGLELFERQVYTNMNNSPEHPIPEPIIIDLTQENELDSD